MDPALLILMRLQARALVRRLSRGLRTFRGAAFFTLGLAVFILWIAPAVWSARLQRVEPEHVRAVVPLILLAVVLLSALSSAGDKAIAFTPGEVDFLFPGPFRRRDLLLYKMGKSTFAAFFSAMILSVALLRNATLWVACFLGCFLALLFVQFFSTFLVLLGQAVSERAYTRARRIMLGVAGVLAALAVRDVLAFHNLSDPASLDLRGAIQQLNHSTPGQILLAPTRVFSQVFTAERVFPDLVNWALLAVLINAALLGLIIRLDANYLEAAATASQRRYERLRRFHAGGVAAAMAEGAKPSRWARVPRLPHLGGAGPIAWRQLTNAVRSSRGLLLVMGILTVVVGPFFFAARKSSGPDDATTLFIALGATMAWFSIILATMLKFDFRADLDAMESLKALPLRPWAVAAGQLVAPTLVLTLIHLLLLGAVAVAFAGMRGLHRPMWTAAVLILPFNLLLFAAENLIFLLLPHRPTASSPGDFQLLGRQMFTLLIRTALVGVCAVIASVPAAFAYFLSGESLSALTGVLAAVMLAEVAALVPLIGWAFQRFDPSVHTPA